MGVRIFLALSTAAWLPYGLYCFLAPETLKIAAGVGVDGPTGTTEIRAMYGGLQIGIGVLCALGAWKPTWRPTAVRTLLLLVGGLLATRAIGVLLDGSFSTYTLLALIFEGATVAAAVYFLE